MKWPKYLDQYPFSVIAEFIGVRESTVSGWKRKGAIPKARVKEARAIPKRVKIKTTRQRKSSLRNTSSEVLFSLLSMAQTPATMKQIAKWKREGDLPLKYRAYLVDAHGDERPKRPRQKKGEPGKEKAGARGKRRASPRALEPVRKESTNYITEDYTWEIGRGLSHELIVDISELVGPLQIERGKKQFRIEGTVEMAFADDDIKNYVLGVVTKTDVVSDVDAWTTQWSNYDAATRALIRRIGQYMKFGFYLDRLTLHVVERKKGKKG